MWVDWKEYKREKAARNIMYHVIPELYILECLARDLIDRQYPYDSVLNIIKKKREKMRGEGHE